MWITSFLYLGEVEVDFLDFVLYGFVVYVDKLHVLLVPVNHGDVLVVEVHHFVCVFDDGRCVASEEELAVSDTDHERAALTGCDNLVGVVLVDDGHGIRSDDLVQCDTYRGKQVEFLLGAYVVDELYEHFCVGVAVELNPFLLQLVFQHGIVLDDAVVDNGQPSCAAHVGVGIRACRFSVGGPPRMGDANRSADVLSFGMFLQVGHLSFCLVYLKPRLLRDQGDARTVVSAVFQSLQSLD